MFVSRGDILSARDPAAAEAAYHEAVAIARGQGARTLELLAALALARLLQFGGRPVEACEALAPALEGFAPTAHPAIAEVQALLKELEATDAVVANRRNRDIHRKYAQTLAIVEGYGAHRTNAALERVEADAAAHADDVAQFAAAFGRYASALMSGRAPVALEIAEQSLRDAEAARQPGLCAIARCLISGAKCNLGSFADAHAHAERALALYDEKLADFYRSVTRWDFLASVYAHLSMASALLGDVQAAAVHMSAAERRADETGDSWSVANVMTFKLLLLCRLDRPQDTANVAEALNELATSKGIGAWDTVTKAARAWAMDALPTPPTASTSCGG